MLEKVTSIPNHFQPAAEKEPVSKEMNNDRVHTSPGLTIQPKLFIGAADDPFEREADNVASQVMRMPESQVVQRQCAQCEEEPRVQRAPFAPFINNKNPGATTPASHSFTRQIEANRGQGQSLSNDARTFMETRFGNSFSSVNIHTGKHAENLSSQIQAKAFTVGNDIYFNQGQYNPSTNEGRHLLAHELTHTIQQGHGQVIQKQGESPGPRGSFAIHSPVVDELLTQVSDIHAMAAGRTLRATERDVVSAIFGTSVDYSRVRLILGDLAAGTTAGNNIRLPADFNIINAEHQQLLVHEMTHVWQFQHNGAGYITTSLLQQLSASASRGNRNFAYDYHITSGNSFFEFAPEQQAFIVENYFAMLRDQAALGSAQGQTQMYKSNHLNAQGFNADLTAAQRSAEISTELPLHEPLVQQMSGTPFISASDLLRVRQSSVLITPPGQDIYTAPGSGPQFLPTPNLFEIRFDFPGSRR